MRAFGVLAVVFFLCTLPVQAATVQGTLSEPGVVWISDGSKPASSSDQATLRQTSRTFVPAVLVVPAGSSVLFPNDDDYLHSVYSAQGPDYFDIGFYSKGPGKLVTFPRPGVNAIACHIHASMHAVIVVADGPFAATTTGNETFTLIDVRPGAHALHVWSPSGGERTGPIKIESAGARIVLQRPL
jgi:plastocyanin